MNSGKKVQVRSFRTFSKYYTKIVDLVLIKLINIKKILWTLLFLKLG
jgi:hypothetical protein